MDEKRFPAIQNPSDQEQVEISVSEINLGKKKKVLELLTWTLGSCWSP